jgi:hypothetical protein
MQGGSNIFQLVAVYSGREFEKQSKPKNVSVDAT